MPGVSKTLAQLIAEVIATIFPNTSNLIDAGQHQQLELDMLASMPNFQTHNSYLGLFPYDTARTYQVGQAVTYNDGTSTEIYICTTITTGAWNASHWIKKTTSTAKEIRMKSVSLLAGSNTVTFDSAMPSSSYEVIIYETTGVGCEVTAKAAANFTITALENCSIIYFAREN